MDDCIFCRIAGEIDSDKIYENDNFFSILDKNPVALGHSLVISKKHFKTALDLPNSLGEALMDAIKNTTLKLMEKYKLEGFNILNNGFVSGGQLVDHVHFHILPRKKGDGIKNFYRA